MLVSEQTIFFMKIKKKNIYFSIKFNGESFTLSACIHRGWINTEIIYLRIGVAKCCGKFKMNQNLELINYFVFPRRVLMPFEFSKGKDRSKAPQSKRIRPKLLLFGKMFCGQKQNLVN